MWYVGLTDDPDRRRVEHGSPPDWRQTEQFPTVDAAEAWHQRYIGKRGYRATPDGAAWRYGYWYQIGPATRE